MRHDPLSLTFTGALFSVAFVLHTYWLNVLEWTADDSTGTSFLWLYATDVAPGDDLEGSFRIDEGFRAAITRIIVHSPTGSQTLWSKEKPWDDTIEVVARVYRDLPSFVEYQHDGSDEVWFVWRVPESVSVGKKVELQLEISYVLADDEKFTANDENDLYFTRRVGFSNHYRTDTFAKSIDIYSPQVSALRRIGKAVLALASFFGIVMLMVIVPRRCAKKPPWMKLATVIAFLPLLIAGGIWFETLISHATRLHGWWLVVLCLMAWCTAPFIAARFRRYDRFAKYLARPRPLPSLGDDPFRSAKVQASTRPLFEVEAALSRQGIAVYRRRHELIAVRNGMATAGQVHLAIPQNELFGDGQSIHIRSDDQAFAVEVVAMLGRIVGELEFELLENSEV